MADYALESAGAEVIDKWTTAGIPTGNALMKIWNLPIFYHTMSPRLALQPNVHPGNCFAFSGNSGFLTVKLARPIYPTNFTIEHIPKVNLTWKHKSDFLGAFIWRCQLSTSKLDFRSSESDDWKRKHYRLFCFQHRRTSSSNFQNFNFGIAFKTDSIYPTSNQLKLGKSQFYLLISFTGSWIAERFLIIFNCKKSVFRHLEGNFSSRRYHFEMISKFFIEDFNSLTD